VVSRHFDDLDFDRPNPGLNCALRSMAVPHDAVATAGQFQVLPPGRRRRRFLRSAPGPAFGGHLHAQLRSGDHR
jgi:hypothetical protein